jgi:PHP family Zn ribbon phosphoesterase
VLTTARLADVAALSVERIAEGVGRVRAGDVHVEPGYDGLYGTVKIWPDQGKRG